MTLAKKFRFHSPPQDRVTPLVTGPSAARTGVGPVRLPPELCQVEEQDLSVLDSFDCQVFLVADGSTVSLMQLFPV